FERAIGMCTGELIALCDQDDVWPAHKLARIVPEFQRHPGVALVFTDGMVVDERLRPTGARLWESFGITPRMVRRVARGEAFPLLTGRNLVTGAAMVFRADLVPLALPVPEDTARIHDGWIALVAAAAAEVVMIGEPLLLYRRHESQQVGPGSPAEWNPGLLERLFRSLRAQPGSYLGEIQALEATRGSLAGRWSGFAESRAARQLDGKIANLRARAALPRGLLRRLPVVLRELTALRYHRFAEGMWSAARDLVGGS
ncbi:MAG TPA: hypothetical protein VF665_05180, partial [Longimicrobium sp.]|uniref:hypothetical protein n=1 Tax=Longimicrobium sp. TaxID=2029185 RepID=UPI002ED879E3